jgi:hypothetical protein
MTVLRENAKMTREKRKNTAKITLKITLNNAKQRELLRPRYLYPKDLLPVAGFSALRAVSKMGGTARLRRKQMAGADAGQAVSLRRTVQSCQNRRGTQRFLWLVV